MSRFTTRGSLGFTLAVAVVLAGCVAPAPPPGEGATAIDVAFDADGCRLAVTVFLVSPEQAARALPDGFTPADAQHLLDAPAPTGRAAVLLGSYACKASVFHEDGVSGAEINILVDAPSVPGDRPVATTHYYQPAVHATGPVRAFMDAHGWRTIPSDPLVSVDASRPGVVTAEASTRDDDGDVFHMTLHSAVPSTLEGTSRFWHVTPTGVAWFDYDVAANVVAGVASCDLRSSSLAAEVAGVTTCVPGDAVGIVVPEFGWTASFHHRPDVWPES